MLTRLFLRLRPLDRLPARVHYALAVLMVAAVLVAHALAPALGGYLFFLLLDAVILAALLFGRGAGVLAALLAAAAAAVLIERAGDAVVLTARDDVAAVLFALMALAVALLIEALRRAVGRLADEAAEKGREAEARELLALEIGHRVKNNLQSVVGLMQLQAARDPAARAAMEALGRRVMVMARVHDRLSVRGDGDGDAVARVDAGAFVRDLADDLRASLLADRPVTLRVDAAALELKPDRATSLGLIVNELLTNALKHAFPLGRAGAVTVGLRPDGDEAVLEVADDGIGPRATGPEDDGPTGGKDGRGGLGTTLVALLARQLDGRVEPGPAAGDPAATGTTVRVRFPCPAAAKDGAERPDPGPEHEPAHDARPAVSPPTTMRPA